MHRRHPLWKGLDLISANTNSRKTALFLQGTPSSVCQVSQMWLQVSHVAQVDQAGKGDTPVRPVVLAITEELIPWRETNFLQKDELSSSQPENTEERSACDHYVPWHNTTAQKNLCDFVGAGFFPTKLDEAWKHFLPDSINPHS